MSILLCQSMPGTLGTEGVTACAIRIFFTTRDWATTGVVVLILIFLGARNLSDTSLLTGGGLVAVLTSILVVFVHLDTHDSDGITMPE